MDASSILTLYLIFFFLELGFQQFLTVLNSAHVRKHSDAIPEQFAGIVTPESYKSHVSYTLVNSRFSIVTSLAGACVLLVVLLSGFLGYTDRWLGGYGFPPYIQGILYIFFISLIFRAAALPFSIYRQFSIEERFGFNTMTPKLFFLDVLKGLALSAVLGFILLCALFWFIDKTGELWWLYGFIFFTAFQLIISVLYPLIIAPLFNKFTPLEEGSLKEKLLDLAGKLQFKTSGIFIMDGSRRSRHSNAYFTGFGKAKRIVLFDTLLTSLSEDQIAAVLAHEIGHAKKRHIVKRLLISLPLTLLTLFIVHLLMQYEPLFQAFGFDGTSVHGIIIILSICASPFTFILSPLLTAWSRRHEYQADRFAVSAMNGSEHLKQALLGLGKENLTNLTPHRLYSFYHYSHPSLGERITAMERMERDLTGSSET